MISAAYLYVNAALYALFAVWCTVNASGTSRSLGFEKLADRGHSEYLVIYGGLQLGLAFMFTLLARNPALHRTGILIALCLYAPIVLYRSITVARYWPLPALTLGTGCLELLLLLAAILIYRAVSITG
jgi:hypothetical protein